MGNSDLGSSPWRTVVDLTLTAGLLALCAALLFPCFARAHCGCGPPSCRSNLKQLGVALTMYAEDYDGALPAETWRANSARWPEAIDVYLRSSQVFSCPQVTIGTSYGLNFRLYRTGLATGERTAPVLRSMACRDKTYLLLECDALLAHPWLAPPVARWHARHRALAGVCYVDGHVSQERPSALDTADRPWPNGWDPAP